MYNSVLVTKLINGVMLDGKKGVAQKVVYDAFDIIKEKTGKEPLDAFTEAMNNIMPQLEVKAFIKKWNHRYSNAPAVSAAQPIRFLSKFVPPVARLWLCAGSWITPASAAKRP